MEAAIEKNKTFGEQLAGIVSALALIAGFVWVMNTIGEGQAAEEKAKMQAAIEQGVALTAKGCPAARDKIREIGADGKYTRREIEVLSALITAEQMKPNGLNACKAPSWRYGFFGLKVSEGYAN